MADLMFVIMRETRVARWYLEDGFGPRLNQPTWIRDAAGQTRVIRGQPQLKREVLTASGSFVEP